MSWDPDRCKAALHTHASLRMPTWDESKTAYEKVSDLEDYLGEVAVARGDLEEARLWMDHARYKLEGEWADVEGWQQLAPSKPTGPQIIEAKRRIAPDIYNGMREAKWLISRLADQIRRLEKDEETASRRYTLIVGG